MDPLTFLAALACAGVGALATKGAEKVAAKRRVKKIVKAAQAVASMPPVTNDQVLAFRLPGHQKCSGTGIVGHWKAASEQGLCECAQKRFMERHKGEVTTIGGGKLVWLRKVAA